MNETYYFIKSRLNGYVLDTDNNTSSVNPIIIVNPQKESDTDNQLWSVTPEGLIKSKLNGHVIDIANGLQTPGATVISHPKNGAHGTPNQHWTIQNGLIISELSGYVLSIKGSNQTPGAHVVTDPKNGANGTPNQLWDLVPPWPKHLILKATDVWLDTGVDVTAGKTLIITATGTWKVAQEPTTPEVTADGFVGFQIPGTELATADFGSMIGRIGEYGAPFFVGSTFNTPSPSSGRLYLQINDVVGTLGDNAGELSVSIEN